MGSWLFDWKDTKVQKRQISRQRSRKKIKKRFLSSQDPSLWKIWEIIFRIDSNRQMRSWCSSDSEVFFAIGFWLQGNSSVHWSNNIKRSSAGKVDIQEKNWPDHDIKLEIGQIRASKTNWGKNEDWIRIEDAVEIKFSKQRIVQYFAFEGKVIQEEYGLMISIQMIQDKAINTSMISCGHTYYPPASGLPRCTWSKEKRTSECWCWDPNYDRCLLKLWYW